eukprot:s225_g1.t1
MRTTTRNQRKPLEVGEKLPMEDQHRKLQAENVAATEVASFGYEGAHDFSFCVARRTCGAALVCPAC